MWNYRYAVKAQTSLAPLSLFHGSRVTTAHVHQCCINFRVMRRLCRREWNWLWKWRCVNRHPWQRTRDHGMWRLTLTAYFDPTAATKLKFSNRIAHTCAKISSVREAGKRSEYKSDKGKTVRISQFNEGVKYLHKSENVKMGILIRLYWI